MDSQWETSLQTNAVSHYNEFLSHPTQTDKYEGKNKPTATPAYGKPASSPIYWRTTVDTVERQMMATWKSIGNQYPGIKCV